MTHLSVAGWLYGRAALARRRYYGRHAEARVRLRCPVISIGSLAVGGSGKTPAAATLARLLLDLGERPAILSRGYARRDAPDGVTVVSDGRRVRADLDRAGDEPLMLARSVPGVAVLVSADRHLAGALAERKLGATVHLLDDGFQHVRLERDIDLLIVDAADVRDGRPMPAGRLREPLMAAREADAVIAVGSDVEMQEIADRLRPARVFNGRRILEAPRLDGDGVLSGSAPIGGRRVVALAAVARPDLFVEAVRRAGFDPAATMTYRDHHPFTRHDIDRLEAEARRVGAELLLTTEKDLIRLRPFRPLPFPVAVLPLRFAIEPAEAFRLWIRTSLATIRNSVAGGQ
ncbi:MAG: tetraacyldisaccharide 4'-kinase [Acidobacteria bacterium]|nr:tetraacyldisaccharide 4'-kinase [Acidobacteriota bacterium]MBI3264573.1 tetraacyldisaccharide 4'-kinase [Acidobacteriota bacterium]